MYGEWINVKDRLPEEKPYRFEYLLVAKENCVVLEAMYNTKIKKFMNRDFTELNHSVTHWMELPDAPGNAQQQVEVDNLPACNRPAQCAKGMGEKCYSGLDCPDKGLT